MSQSPESPNAPAYTSLETTARENVDDFVSIIDRGSESRDIFKIVDDENAAVEIDRLVGAFLHHQDTYQAIRNVRNGLHGAISFGRNLGRVLVLYSSPAYNTQGLPRLQSIPSSFGGPDIKEARAIKGVNTGLGRFVEQGAQKLCGTMVVDGAIKIDEFSRMREVTAVAASLVLFHAEHQAKLAFHSSYPKP